LLETKTEGRQGCSVSYGRRDISQGGSRVKKIIETILSKIQRRDPCFEIYPYYGVAPHKHVMSYAGEIAVTFAIPKEEWPDNFVEDEDAPGCGTWFCPNKKCRAKCRGKL
jgi:hypothetical protein